MRSCLVVLFCEKILNDYEKTRPDKTSYYDQLANMNYMKNKDLIKNY